MKLLLNRSVLERAQVKLMQFQDQVFEDRKRMVLDCYLELKKRAAIEKSHGQSLRSEFDMRLPGKPHQ
jgi:hypothetical protein